MKSKEEISRRAVFLQAIAKVCREHGYCISHEDRHGAFLVEAFDEATLAWLLDADYSAYVQK